MGYCDISYSKYIEKVQKLMIHVNIIWPEEIKTEYLCLFHDICNKSTDAEMEDEEQFANKVDKYILDNASHTLKEWLLSDRLS